MMFLQASQVVKRYSNHLALDRVDLEVPESSIFGLLGPNGAGKTTLIRIINQITAPDEGTIMFNGRKLSSKDVVNIGYLPEERGLYKKMKVGEQALYLAQLKGLSRQDALKKLKLWFEKFEIQNWWDKKVEELSKGMQQKVQFIVTVLHSPALLIFDEPFSGFDPINANILKQEILNLRNSGATVIFSTHNMSSVEEICDNITLINQGKTILSGKVNEVRRRYNENIAKIEFSGDKSNVVSSLGSNYKILEEKEQDNIYSLLLKMPEGADINRMLQQVMAHCHIHSCQEVMPSMNDVFIRVVGESQKPN